MNMRMVNLFNILIAALVFCSGKSIFGSPIEKEKADYSYYVFIPGVIPDKHSYVLSGICVQLDSSGAEFSLPANTLDKSAEFFSFLYSVSKFTPEHPTKEHPWGGTFSLFAGKAKADEEDNVHELPSSIVNLIVLIHKLRDYTSKDLICQPIFSSLDDSSGWRNVSHLNIYIGEAGISPHDRCKWITHCIYGEAFLPPDGTDKNWEPSIDVAVALRERFARYQRIQYIRYWPEYNIAIIKADAAFGERARKMFEML